MKKLLLTSIAALFLATGAVQAAENDTTLTLDGNRKATLSRQELPPRWLPPTAQKGPMDQLTPSSHMAGVIFTPRYLWWGFIELGVGGLVHQG